MLEIRNQWCVPCLLFVLALLASPAASVESLELGVATQNGTSTTSGQDNYTTALSLNNPASNSGPVLVVSSFSSKSNGNDPKIGSWRLGHGADRSLALTRSLNDGSKDTGIVNVVEIFDNVAPNAALLLEHADDSAARDVDTFLITMATVPLTTDGGFTIAHDRDDQDPDDDGTSHIFSTSSSTYVPVEKAAATQLEISIPVVDAAAPRAVFVAAVLNTESDGTAAVATFQLQTTGTGVPSWTDVGPESTRLLSGGDDKGAGVIYAIADNLAAGIHRFRLQTKTSDGSLSVFSSTLVGVSLVFSGPVGQGGYFPHFQETVASAVGTNANLQPVTGLEADFTLNAESDVFLAMSFSAQTTSSGAGDKGSWEAGIRSGPTFVFGDENGPPSQEVDRFFGAAVDVGAPPVSTNDIGAGGLVAVAQNLAIADYTAIGQHAITGNPMNTLEPNLVGFVPVSVATTPAVVSGLRAVTRHGQVFVEWETVAEDGTLGFHLYRLDPASGEYARVGRRLVASRLAAQGSRYALEDPGVLAEEESTYVLVEVAPGGRDRVHGPYRVRIGADESLLTESLIEGSDRSVNRQAASSRPPSPARLSALVARRPIPPRAVSRLDLLVSESGLYSLSAEEIARHLGRSSRQVEAAIRAGRMRLSHRGREVAWRGLGAGEAILFFATGFESRYTDMDVFQLRFGKGTPMEEVSGRPAEVAAAADFETTEVMEENRIPATAWVTDPSSDIWFWDILRVGSERSASWGTRFDLEAVAATSAQQALLELTLMDLTGPSTSSGQRLELSINGHPIGEARWTGGGRRTLAIAFDQSLLRERDNELLVSTRREPGGPGSTVLLDRLAVTYHRLFRAGGDELTFVSGGERAISVTGFGDPRVLVVDVTDPDAARWVEDARIEAADDGYRMSFEPPRPGRYLALSAPAIRTALAVEAGYESDLRSPSNRADHLVIAPRKLIDLAGALAEHRTAAGLLSRAVELEEIFHEFNHGLADPEAIRKFLRFTHREWADAPRYVVLAGRGTFDPRGFGDVDDNLVPVKFVRGVQGITAADALLGDVVDDDGIPEIAVGRLPVVTRSDLETMIAKLIRYDEAGGGGWADWAIVAADNPDDAGDFEAFAENLVALWPEPDGVQRIYLAGRPVAEAREELLSALHQGAGLLTYVGHAGGDRLAAEGLLRSEDLAGVDNGERLPVFTAATCLVNRFDIPGYPSLGESLVLHPTGGTVAAWSAAGQSFNGPAAHAVSRFVAHLFTEGATGRIGDAALAVARGESGNAASSVPLFTLLGDPATKVK